MALQSQATRLTGRGPGEGAFRRDGAITLSGSVSQYRITPGATNRAHTQGTIRPPGAAGFQIELFPLHSPLLRESWLVSLPPLSNMFKFSGSSYLTSALSYRGSLGRPSIDCEHASVGVPRRDASRDQPAQTLKRSFLRSNAQRSVFGVWKTSLKQACSDCKSSSSNLRSKI